MIGFDTNEQLLPLRGTRGAGAILKGAILCDPTMARQAGLDPPEGAWFDPVALGERARPVAGSGRGGAWFVDAPGRALVLRHYLRGGKVAAFNRDWHLWRGMARSRSFAEFRLLHELRAHGLPVPAPVAACYWRSGMGYHAAILLVRIEGVRSLAERAQTDGRDAPWEEAGRLVARMHRAGVDHADLNAHNLLFGNEGRGWIIDFDRARVRIPATGWRELNLRRLARSLEKIVGAGAQMVAVEGMRRLRRAYETRWERGT
jgi:3-deoxy-D-manno-octulosonic acid kinase